jgi:chloride channel protein, CIC family
MNWFQKGTPVGLFILAIAVGLGGAVGATIFHLLIQWSTYVFYGHSAGGNFVVTVEAIPLVLRVLIPALGGLLVGIIYKYAKVTEAEGEGVPEVMEALAHKQGTIRPVVAPVKIITAAITLGSGGSAGREGPVIQIGSAVGSSVAQLFKLDPQRRSLLLAAGAAAGIGGTFGAPVAGILFTYEILHHRLTLFRGAIIATAALIGTLGAQLLTGGKGLRFIIENDISISLILLITLVTIGMVSAFVAIGFGNTLTLGRKLFQAISLPHVLKPALGGLLIGVIGLYLPYIHEPAAYPLTIDLIAVAGIPLVFLGILLVVKTLATALTLGSGGSGGIFAPLLLTGAILGSIIAQLLLHFELITNATATVIVIAGMAAVFAAAAHAPLTASFILFEMTENVWLLPLLLLVCFLASFIAKHIKKESIYHIHE